jgi:hypothetical protein
VEPERSAGDETHAVVESFHTCVGDAEADRGEDPVAVFADGATELDEPVDAAALRPPTPAVEQAGGLGR